MFLFYVLLNKRKWFSLWLSRLIKIILCCKENTRLKRVTSWLLDGQVYWVIVDVDCQDMYFLPWLLTDTVATAYGYKPVPLTPPLDVIGQTFGHNDHTNQDPICKIKCKLVSHQRIYIQLYIDLNYLAVRVLIFHERVVCCLLSICIYPTCILWENACSIYLSRELYYTSIYLYIHIIW